MTVKRVVLAALLGSSLLLPAGMPITVTAAATPGMPGATYTGTWQGQTGQDRLIKFRVNTSNRVTYLVAGYKVSSGGCTITARSTLRNLSAPINSEQKFTVRSSSANTTLVVKGTMTSKTKARGTLKVSITDTTGFGCSGSAYTTWRAHKL